jgi:short-subunit dehydrogenase
MEQKKAVIMGASSGIGKELAKILSGNGYIVGLAARRINLLDELQKELPNKSFVKQIDVSKPQDAEIKFQEMITEMGGVDLVVISSGYGDLNYKLKWSIEKETIDVNVTGFALIAGISMRHFMERGSGHLVGISSIAALRGQGDGPSYAASKAFVSNYLEGLRHIAIKSGKLIYVTDVQPGFVKTPMSKGNNLFWISTAEKAANQIYHAIAKKKTHAYITKRWRLIAWLLKAAPDWIYYKT